MLKLRLHHIAAVHCAALIIVCAAPVTAQSRHKRTTGQPAASTSGAPVNSVVATVNGEVITREMVADDLLNGQTAQLNVTLPAFASIRFQRGVAGSVGALVLKRMETSGGKPVTITHGEIVNWLFTDNPPTVYSTVQRMITERCVWQAARANHIAATPAEIMQRMSQAIETGRNRYHLPGLSEAQVLRAVGFRRDFFVQSVTTSLLIEKLIKHDIEKQFGHPVSAADFVDASHILLRITGNTPQEIEKSAADGLTKITGYLADIRNGKITFDDAALRYSDDQSKFQKGALGVFLRGQMVPAFDAAVFKLKEGEVSDPVRSPFGWHIIKLNRSGAHTTGPERAAALESYMTQRVQPKVRELIAAAKVTNKVKPPVTGGSTATAPPQ